MILTKHRHFSPRNEYFNDGQHVASYDGGPCSLYFADGKEYSFSLWSEDWVKDRIFPKGAAHVACIIDYDYQVVSDEESASRIFYHTHGGITYTREGEVTIVAHSETPLDSNSSWVIVCNNNAYNCIYKKKFFYSIAKIFKEDNLIGSIFTADLFIYHRSRSSFTEDIPLSDSVFITLLAYPWFHREVKEN